jgi:tetratricopeptide (TPR) repeat protein
MEDAPASGSTMSGDTSDDTIVPGPVFGAVEQATLRRAAGCVELCEPIASGEEHVSTTVARLLRRALAEIATLPPVLQVTPQASLVAGAALRSLGEWQTAIGPLERASLAGPRAARLEAWMGLGWCWKRLDRVDLAIAALDSGLAVFPGLPVLHYNLACYHSLAGNVPAAIDHLQKAIELDDTFRDLTGSERDFDSIRSDPRFVAVVHVAV